eukprot:2659905-Pleurochrysis_carterae.AAC.2
MLLALILLRTLALKILPAVASHFCRLSPHRENIFKAAKWPKERPLASSRCNHASHSVYSLNAASPVSDCGAQDTYGRSDPLQP